MAVYKRGGVWWYEFIFAGQRVRESSKQTKKTLALEAEKRRRAELERAHAGMPATEKAKDRIRTVNVALAAYRKAYPVSHREKSVQVVNERSVPLEKHLGQLLMPDLTEERITAYMADRKAEGVSNRTINLELSVLSRAIGHPFKLLWPKLRRLEERHDIGRALSPKEEQAIVDATARSRSRLIGPFVRIALYTGMRRDEIRLLRWGQIDFQKKNITVGKKAKTEAGRGRVIPIGPMLEAILSTHASWYAATFGPLQPEWHVFPFCRRAKPVDPTHPVTSLKKAWGSICKTAGVQCRIHDCRHTVCTKMAEAGVPEATMLDIMGHMSAVMLRRYSHIRQAAKIEAMQAIESRSAFSIEFPTKSPTFTEELPLESTVTH